MEQSSPTGSRGDSRLQDTLERLLMATTADLRATLSHAADLVADATGADKVDCFLYDAARDSLAATGSNQPLSALQRKLGLDVLQVANGGRVVHVFKTGRTFMTGRLDEDPEELRGIKEGLGIRSKLGVPLVVDGAVRGMMMLASLKHDFFTEEDARYAEAVGRWIGVVVHRAELSRQISRNALEEGRRAGAEELVTVLAHDLRNALSPLVMRLHSLRHRLARAGVEDAMEDLDVAGRATTRLTSLVNDILDVSRIDQGVFQIHPEPVDLVALLSEVADTFSLPEQRVRVLVQADGPATVVGDSQRLRQVLENLVANAVQKSPRGAEVTALVMNETRESGGWVRVDVLDQGPGIPEHMLPHLFERFSTAKAREGGLGLGLYIAKRVTAMHGGELTARSEPGKGARFTLALPCAPREGKD